ncbi:MAG: prephenate dehydratase [Propionibacteriales bacterium]|nr:prephenate dehydratase [Propionibacteriales bacterium]
MPGVPPARYAYLGPEGTFTETALRSVPAAAKAELRPCATITIALDAVRDGEVDGAVVPIENSVEGSVAVTLDELAVGEPLVITREMTVPVRLTLLGRPGSDLFAVRRVVTHPHAAAQCRRWLAKHLPEAEVVQAPSTAQAAQMVANKEDEYDAAIAAPLAAEKYRLSILAHEIGDNGDAVTRFVLASRPAPVPPPTGADKTSLVAFIGDDHPGALLEVLEEFSVRGVNLTRIESRPTGTALGRYCFSIDAEGHVTEKRVGEALMGLRRVCADVRFLGSYPRVDKLPPTMRRGTSDDDFRDAEVWLARLRAGEGA